MLHEAAWTVSFAVLILIIVHSLYCSLRTALPRCAHPGSASPQPSLHRPRTCAVDAVWATCVFAAARQPSSQRSCGCSCCLLERRSQIRSAERALLVSYYPTPSRRATFGEDTVLVFPTISDVDAPSTTRWVRFADYCFSASLTTTCASSEVRI